MKKILHTKTCYAMAGFALSAIVILFVLFYSCSIEETTPDEPVTIEEETEEEVIVADRETTVTEKQENEEENPYDTPEDPYPSADDETEVPEDDPPGLLLLEWTVSEKEISFEFSLPVNIIGLHFDPEQEAETTKEDGTVTVILEENPEPGQQIEVILQVEDEEKNALEVKVSFRFKNNRVPKLLINELRTEYSKPRVEFIEFKMLSDGNLGGLQVFAASNIKNPMIYEFEPVEVLVNDYVVLHLRTLDEELCIDEYNGDRTESGGKDSSLTAWDFWIPGSNKLLRKTDAVYVQDQEKRILDAVIISEKPDLEWEKDYLAEAAGLLFSKGAWKSADGGIPGPMDVVNSFNIKTSSTRSISRDETVNNSHTAEDWYITANSGATPGEQNNPKRF